MSLPIDLQFRGVGRLHLRSGTNKKQVRDAMKQMLRTLFQIGRSDILRDLKAPAKVSVMEVYERFRLGKIDQLPTGALMRPLVAAWHDWMDGKEIATDTHHDYTEALRRLTIHGPAGVALSDLPALLQAHRKTSKGVHPRSFNKDRAAALSCLGSVLGAHHWLYGECARCAVLKIPKERKMQPNPQTVEQVRVLGGKLAPHHALTMWGFALTGMRPEEMFETKGCRWSGEADRIRIEGAKRAASNRVVPRVGLIVKPSTGRLAFYRALRKASGNTVAPYDLRRTYAQWLELAEIPTFRQDYYMAHGPKDLNALYKRAVECQKYLAEDAKALEQVTTCPTKSPTSGGSNG